jgi:hypothetical protein
MTMRILVTTLLVLVLEGVGAAQSVPAGQEATEEKHSSVFDRVVAAVGLGASLRTIGAFTVNYPNVTLFGDHRADAISQTLLRLTAEQKPVSWLRYELHAVQGVIATTQASATPSAAESASAQTTNNRLGTLPVFGTGAGATRYRAWQASWEWATESTVNATLWLDRLNITFVLPWLDVIVGRQAITFGKAYFWNPLDVFLPFDPRQLDRDYKAGVDAVRLNIPFGEFTGLNLIGVLGSTVSTKLLGDRGFALSSGDLSWEGSALVARFYTTIGGFDLSLQAGKVYAGYQTGAGVVGELGPIEVRGEAAYFIVEETGPLPVPSLGSLRRSFFSGVFGLGHRFANTLTLEGEYLFNGLGDPRHLESAFLRVAASETLHAGQHLLGLMGSYEILPILTASLVWIFSFSDYSSLLQPGLALSLANEVDFVFGAMIGLGKRPVHDLPASEFGTYPNIFFLEFKFYL